MPVVSSEPEVKYRIGTVVGFFIVSTAFFFDAIGFLLMLTGIGEIMTEIIGITGSILFFFWFLFLRVSFMSGKATAKLGVMGAGSIVEIIPFVNGISPTFTIETVSLIYITRKEDKEKAEKDNEARLLKGAQQQQKVEQKKTQFNNLKRQMQQERANDLDTDTREQVA